MPQNYITWLWIVTYEQKPYSCLMLKSIKCGCFLKENKVIKNSLFKITLNKMITGCSQQGKAQWACYHKDNAYKICFFMRR